MRINGMYEYGLLPLRWWLTGLLGGGLSSKKLATLYPKEAPVDGVYTLLFLTLNLIAVLVVGVRSLNWSMEHQLGVYDRI